MHPCNMDYVRGELVSDDNATLAELRIAEDDVVCVVVCSAWQTTSNASWNGSNLRV